MNPYAMKHGKPMKRRPNANDFVRFFKKVSFDNPDDCWNWLGHKDDKGYGQFWFNGKVEWAHRFAKQAFHGLFSPGQQGDHVATCLNPSCVNPFHVKPESVQVNTANGNRNRKKRKAMKHAKRTITTAARNGVRIAAGDVSAGYAAGREVAPF